MAKVNVNIYSTTSVMVTLRIIRRATAAATIIYSRIYVVVLQRQHPGQRGNGAALHPLILPLLHLVFVFTSSLQISGIYVELLMRCFAEKIEIT